VPSRAAIVGNPSDGFYGGTIAVPVRNWNASVTLESDPEKKGVHLKLNPEHDRHSFRDLEHLAETTGKEGPYGGIRLLRAMLKQFYEHCQQNGIHLHNEPFTLSYDTEIPRQVGLAGSSAIITACIKCLIEFYGITEKQIPKPIQANLVLDAERKELGISAGLQDRVVQVYNQPVYMDFSKEAFEASGQKHGRYLPISAKMLPNFFLVYSTESKISGRVLANLYERHASGERLVVDGMRRLAGYTKAAMEAINRGDLRELARLMDLNLDTRREMVGGERFGRVNLEMMSTARQNGACANFSGSGGAIIGIYQDDQHYRQLEKAFNTNGYEIVKVQVQ
jgi:glucuronokinase